MQRFKRVIAAEYNSPTVEQKINARTGMDAISLNDLCGNGKDPVKINVECACIVESTGTDEETGEVTHSRRLVMWSTDGEAYVTGSESFITRFDDIYDCVLDYAADQQKLCEPFTIKCASVKSKNEGYYLICSLASIN